MAKDAPLRVDITYNLEGTTPPIVLARTRDGKSVELNELERMLFKLGAETVNLDVNGFNLPYRRTRDEAELDSSGKPARYVVYEYVGK